jgi:hypothetical protein
MERLSLPAPTSAGILLTYKCSGACKHCLYASSPSWSSDWLSMSDAELILSQLARSLDSSKYRGVGFNSGIHFTGGEPFLNYDLLLKVTSLAHNLGIRSILVETNCVWCTNDEATHDRMRQLRDAGLAGILISANPFVVEHVPFERIKRAVRIGLEVLGSGVMVYQFAFYEEFLRMGLRGRLSLEEYLQRGGRGLRHAELLAGGRVAYGLGHLFRHYPAHRFFGESCRHELIRDWHIHIDNYCNFVPGFCAGISLGDGRSLEALCSGIDLTMRPVVQALLGSLGELYELGTAEGYQELDGYVSKCHLCIDIRRHLAAVGGFEELQPRQFYERLAD